MAKSRKSQFKVVLPSAAEMQEKFRPTPEQIKALNRLYPLLMAECDYMDEIYKLFGTSASQAFGNALSKPLEDFLGNAGLTESDVEAVRMFRVVISRAAASLQHMADAGCGLSGHIN